MRHFAALDQDAVVKWQNGEGFLFLDERKRHVATRCNTLQHNATHDNIMQHNLIHDKILQHIATHCNTLQHTATHCNTLQHTATHCNTLHNTATHCKKKDCFFDHSVVFSLKKMGFPFLGIPKMGYPFSVVFSLRKMDFPNPLWHAVVYSLNKHAGAFTVVCCSVLQCAAVCCSVLQCVL